MSNSGKGQRTPVHDAPPSIRFSWQHSARENSPQVVSRFLPVRRSSCRRDNPVCDPAAKAEKLAPAHPGSPVAPRPPARASPSAGKGSLHSAPAGSDNRSSPPACAAADQRPSPAAERRGRASAGILGSRDCSRACPRYRAPAWRSAWKEGTSLRRAADARE